MSAKPISLYPSAELRARIERVAAVEDRSMNWLCLRWVEEGLAQAEQTVPAAEVTSTTETPPHVADRPRRTTRCEHGFSPDQHCKRCDP